MLNRLAALMLATMAFTVQVVNSSLLVAGALCCVGVIVWLVRSGAWRDPLAGVELPRQGPTIAGVATVLLAFFALQLGALSALGGDANPGSVAWHRVALADSAIMLLDFERHACLSARTAAGEDRAFQTRCDHGS